MRLFTLTSRLLEAMAVVAVLSMAVTAEAAMARAAKDGGELKKAVNDAAHYLQTRGFIDPMATVEEIDHKFLAIEVHDDNWKKMTKEQKVEFLNKVNDYAIGATGGMAVEIRIQMHGTTVATTAVTGGNQVLRLVE